MQPLLTQVPPKRLRSTIATLRPSRVSRPASEGPDWPVPMMMASYRVVIVYALPARMVQTGARLAPAGSLLPGTGWPAPGPAMKGETMTLSPIGP